MHVMLVRYMRVAVRDHLMAMPVTVRTRRQRIVGVQVMAVAMGVGVFMFQRLMHMRMGVTLHQVQQHAGQHQQRPAGKPDRGAALA